MRFRPFDKPLREVDSSDLAKLTEVAEGWYVEYKSQSVASKSIAKSLAAFANHYGGWLFFGVQQSADKSNRAGTFPGIPTSEIASLLEMIRNASKDLVSPHVFYETRVFDGPLEAINLPSGRAIVTVAIPSGADPPYVHNDGRIYRRVGDSSDPKPETDRALLDQLSQRASKFHRRLEQLISRKPTLSKAEDEGCYIHIILLSDPYEIRGHFFRERFNKFVEIMRGPTLPFDNCFPSAEGYVARQVGTNDPYQRLLTWEFSFRCHSYVTYPLNYSRREALGNLSKYKNGQSFVRRLKDCGLMDCRIIDLNQLFDICAAITDRHRRLAAIANTQGPFYCKVQLENVWRTVPFVDLQSYPDHIEKHGFPVVQDSDIFSPPGTELNTFIMLDECTPPGEFFDAVSSFADAARILSHILPSLGIPAELLIDTNEFLELGQRARKLSRQ